MVESKGRGLLAAALTAYVAATAQAQQPDDSSGLAPVVVTGSRLAGAATRGALPVQVITRTDIERSGAKTTAELMALVSANQPFQGEGMSIGNTGPAAYAGANLRGLGDDSTLVLVNGRRIAQHAEVTYGSGADLQSIPLAAVDRVEILKDGASAIYGADAVGGVINFILRRDYSGVTLDLDIDGTQGGGGQRKSLSLTSGGALGQTSVHWVGTLSWQKQERLAATQRAFSRSAYIPGLVNGLSFGTWPATVSDANGSYSPAACRAPFSRDDPDASGLCVYDPATQMDLLPSSERLNGFLRVDGQAWRADTRWYAEVMGSQAIQTTTAPAGWVSGFDVSSGLYLYPSLPESSPYYPSAYAAANGLSGPLTVDYWRMADQGSRKDRHVGVQQRWLLGLEGQDGGWTWDGAGMVTRHRLVSSMRGGYYRYSDLEAMVADGSLNPFGEQSSATQSRLNALEVRDSYRWLETRTMGVDLKGSRSIGRMAGGDASVAVGSEVRREVLGSDYSTDTVTCAISAGQCGGFDLKQSRVISGFFGELSLPFAADWSAQLALRHDHYSVSGRATSPKLALKWQAAPAMLWRASMGKGFIAPTLDQLYEPAALGFAPGSDVQDDSLCSVTGSAYDCGRFGHDQRTSGNAQLKPETSRQTGLGVVLGGTSRWQASLDAWAIDKHDHIGRIPAGTVLANQALYESLGYLPRYQPGELQPDGTICAANPCSIRNVDAQYRNLGRQKVAGFDLGGRWRSMGTPMGIFSLSLDGTWVQRFKTQISPYGSYENQLGRYALDRPVPRWRHHAMAGWEQGDWRWTLGHRFVASYVDFNPDPSTLADRRVRPQSLWDLQAAYRWSDAVSFTLGVQNLFNTAPPPSRQANSFQVGYDPHFADPRGRIVGLKTRISL